MGPFFLTPQPARYNPSSSFGANVTPVALSWIGLSLDSIDSRLSSPPDAASELLEALFDDDTAFSQLFSMILSLSAGLTPSLSKNTSQNASHNPGADPTTVPSTDTLTPSSEQSNSSVVPGDAAPLAATPSRMSCFSVSTALLSDVRGSTDSAIAAAIFSAATLKFILSTNNVDEAFDAAFKLSRSAVRAPSLLDLGNEAIVPTTSSLAYTPTE
ncbi:hypothetical protein ACHAWC_006212 [Mediolabrus comicus]